MPKVEQIDREDGLREQGVQNVLSWLRDRGAMKPPAVLWHAASVLADQFEQERIPRSARLALTKGTDNEG